MIWVTGDMHGEMSAFKREKINKIKKNDSLIVCGDFGFVWDGSKEEKRRLKWIGKRKYTVLFADGCNENFLLLDSYPTVDFAGGKARKISGNLMQLLRGETYEIDGKVIFVFGGGQNDNKELVVSKGTLSTPESPDRSEVENGINNLLKYDNKVDLIVTHDAPSSIKGFINIDDNEQEYIHVTLENFKNTCKFKMWCFGKYHQDRLIPPYYQQLFEKVMRFNPI